MAVSLADTDTVRTVTVLGSTGSVGTNTLDLISRNPEQFRVTALTAHRQVDRLIDQVHAVGPDLAVIGDESLLPRLRAGIEGTSTRAAAGPDAVVDAARCPSDMVVAGIVGASGLRSTLAAAKRGAMVAFANKECLVCAGDLMLQEVHDHGATLLPVDSEHNAIYQVLDVSGRDQVERLILTASGGPFRTWTRDEMAKATPAQAVAHPTWDMGAKISIDSATMMNKGLEIIEAAYLFELPESMIDVVVHPQSVIHSMVEYADTSVLAQLGTPDMRTPIAYALAWPKRMKTPSQHLDFSKISTLTFEMPDEQRFPALALARAALRQGQGAPTALNAANEVAVDRFLAGKIGFLQIMETVDHVLNRIHLRSLGSIDEIEEMDRSARRLAMDFSDQRASLS